jgi:hypothetical protein
MGGGKMTQPQQYFIPVVRQGLANCIQTKTASNGRADLNVKLSYSATTLTGERKEEHIAFSPQLYGPGDMTGFDPRIVARVDPPPDSQDFEDNCFPAIEFADPDFAWRYTPAQANDKGQLQPWITLIVLEIGKEFVDTERGPTGPLPVITVNTATLPPLEYAWRWAHAHVVAKEGADLRNILKDERERPNCRLLCTRRLEQNTRYAAFVVPSFKSGVLAGLGEPPRASIEPAWDHEREERIRIPYYYRWEFKTGPGGDFKSLVEALEPKTLVGLGVSDIHCGKPGFGVRGVRRSKVVWPEWYYLGMEGALQSVDAGYTNWGRDAEKVETLQTDLAELISNPDAQRVWVKFDPPILEPTLVSVTWTQEGIALSWRTSEECKVTVDYGNSERYGQTKSSTSLSGEHKIVLGQLALRPAYHFRIKARLSNNGQAETQDNTFSVPPLPTVVPPLYGRWHFGKDNVDATESKANWFNRLNLDPRHRAAAGLGAEVIRRHQEELMAAAWDQLGEIESVADGLRYAQLGREVSACAYYRLGNLPDEVFTQVTCPALEHTQVKITTYAGGDTTAGLINEPAYRRISRPRGPLRRRQKGPTPSFEKPQEREFIPKGTIGPDDLIHRLSKAYLPKIQLSYQTMRFDMVAQESKTLRITVHNKGDANLTVSPVIPEHLAEAGFSFKPQTLTISPGESQNMEVTCSPAQAGVYQDVLVFTSNDPLNGEIQVPCQVYAAESNWLTVKAQMFSPVAKSLKVQLSSPTRRGGSYGTPESWYLEVHDVLAPWNSIPKRVKSNLLPNDYLESRFNDDIADHLAPIQWAPHFETAMYNLLRDLGQQVALPGVDHILSNGIGILKVNQRFIESYMCGLNHEFAAELLWRGYPTDQRGTYFRQFWDIAEYAAIMGESEEEFRDIKPLSDWRDDLGSNRSSGQDYTVLVIRGDLLKRYPNTIIYAVKAQKNDPGVPILPKNFEQGELRFPVFKATLPPDLTFLGFPFTIAQAKGSDRDPGMFIILEERIGEPRFGLNTTKAELETWNNLSWEDFFSGSMVGQYLDKGKNQPKPQNPAGQSWTVNASSAVRAWITMRQPVRVAIHASQMLPYR